VLITLTLLSGRARMVAMVAACSTTCVATRRVITPEVSIQPTPASGSR
jgi:hypothetical protein